MARVGSMESSEESHVLTIGHKYLEAQLAKVVRAPGKECILKLRVANSSAIVMIALFEGWLMIV